MPEDNQVAISEPRESRAVSKTGVYSDLESFESAQRIGTALSKSGMIPKDYQNNLPNILVAMEMANRIGMSPVVVMQNVYIIHGKPSFSSKFIIAAINGCNRFAPLRWHVEGQGDNKTCYAYTTCKTTGDRLDGPVTGMQMAKAEGWISKAGSKWKTMPDLMMRYRAATFFGNLYAPDILMGFSTVEERDDIKTNTRPQAKASNISQPPPEMEVVEAVEAEYIPANETNLNDDKDI